MAGTHFYVDGLNLYYGALRGTPHKWLDLRLLARALLPYDELGLVRYFTANVKPQFPGDRAHERQNAYLRALAACPEVVVVKAHFRNDVRRRALAVDESGGNPFLPPLRPGDVLRDMLDDGMARSENGAVLASVRTPEEKGSDVSLGAHLVRDALTGRCDKAIVVTNDSDLTEPIRMAVEEGVPVGVANPHRGATSRRLLQVASFEVPFRHRVVADCQLPTPVVTGTGRQVHKPREW